MATLFDIKVSVSGFMEFDAPESSQVCKNAGGRGYRCGSASTQKLRDILSRSTPTRCEFVEWDTYGRTVSNCYRADNENIAALMVQSGHALDGVITVREPTRNEQQVAKKQKVALWQGKFTEPWKRRAEHREQTQTVDGSGALVGDQHATASGCRIKGNISSESERIYHTPGQRYYETINASKGERMFCSRAEARAAD